MNATVLCFCYATLLGFSNTNTMNNKLSLLNTIRNSVSQKQDLISYFKNLDPKEFSFDNKLKKSVKWLKGEIAENEQGFKNDWSLVKLKNNIKLVKG